MARNKRPGNKWIPGVIRKQLGPLTFLVETNQGILWKRHIDHLQDRQTDETSASDDLEDDYMPPDIPTDIPEETTSPSRYPVRVHNPPDRYM